MRATLTFPPAPVPSSTGRDAHTLVMEYTDGRMADVLPLSSETQRGRVPRRYRASGSITSGPCRGTTLLCPWRFRPRLRVEGGTIPIVSRREEDCALVIAVLGSTELVGGLCRTAANDCYTDTITSVVINTIGAGTCTNRNNNTGAHITTTGWHN